MELSLQEAGLCRQALSPSAGVTWYPSDTGQWDRLTTEDRSTFSILRSCSSTGWRPATRSCTEDVRYTKLSSQSPLQAEIGATGLSLGRLGL